MIFVRLRQFQPEDRTRVKFAMSRMECVPAVGRPGVAVMPLYRDDQETRRAKRCASAAEVVINLCGGGAFEVGGDDLVAGFWVRLPQAAGCAPLPGPTAPGSGSGFAISGWPGF